MNSSFRNQLLEDIEQEYGDSLDKMERDLIDCAVTVLSYKAARRVRDALVTGMGATKGYHYDVQFKTAVDMLAQAAVNAIFGDGPPTQAELAVSYNLVTADWFKESPLWPSGSTAKAAEVTKEKLMAALEELKAPSPYGQVTMGKNAGKQKPVPVAEPTVAELWEIVERRSKELAGQKAKKAYPGVFGDDEGD